MKCKGKNKDGTPCNRDISDDSEYCYRHINGVYNKITYFLADIFGIKRRSLTWLFIFAIIIFLIQGYANYQYNQILENIQLKPDVEVEISPFLYSATFGEYLPLIVTNTGDYTFKDVHVFIHSCEMPEGYYEHYKLPLLPAHSERAVPFGNKDVIEAFKKGNCYPFAGEERSAPSFSFNLSEMKAGENYTAYLTGCGRCYFDANVFAEYDIDDEKGNITFNKNVRSYFGFPVNITAGATITSSK